MLSRIKKYIDFKGISVSAFEKSIGMSNASFGKSLKSGGGIGSDKLEKFLKVYPDVNPEWLLTGSGEMIKSKVLNDPKAAYMIKNVESKIGIPLIPIDAIAGFASGTGDAILAADLDYYSVPDFQGKADYLIRVSGSSMSPKYNNGDIIACKKLPLNTFFQWNKVYVLDTIQGPLVKRVKKSKEGFLLLVSDNERYEPFDISVKEINSLAIVIGVIRLE